MQDTKTFVENVPKLENHIHLGGAYSTELLYQLAKKYVNDLPEVIEDPITKTRYRMKEIISKLECHEDLLKYVTCGKNSSSLWEFLLPFQFLQPIISAAVQNDENHLEELAFRFVGRQKESNCVYTEVRVSPHYVKLNNDMGRYQNAKCVLEIVLRGLRRGEKEFGVRVNLILCCINLSPELSEDIPILLEEFYDPNNEESCNVVSADVVSGETHFGDPRLGDAHKKALDVVHNQLGLPITIHAGESTGGEAVNVKKAVEEYGAIRIGHGYRILENISLLEKDIPEILVKDPKRKEKRLHFECCPSSSYYTGGFAKDQPWEQHPIRKLFEMGHSVGLNTDDPAVIGTTLNEEWMLCLDKIKMTKKQMFEMQMMQLDSCFISQREKNIYRKQITNFYTENQLL